MTERTDIVVIGGGPVGAALALALAGSGFALTVLEAHAARRAVDDPRPLALSHGSRLILERLGVWEALAPVTPIRRIHVSQHGGFGRVALAATEAGLPALGYVIEYARLQAALARALTNSVPQTLTGAKMTAIKPARDATSVEFTLDGAARAVTARLAVIADGGALQDLAPVKTVDYRQSAVVAMVESELPHHHTAYERFTADGPLALLPCGDGLALIWAASPERAQFLCAQPADEFLAGLCRHFGGRLGAFRTVGARTVFPLTLKYVDDVALPHTVLVGNAAQALHPVAGQGFNLGLRDAWELATQLTRTDPGSIGSAEVLAAYRRRRRLDRGGGIRFTDALVRLFSNDVAPLGLARGIGMTLLGCVSPAKAFVVRRMIFGARG